MCQTLPDTSRQERAGILPRTPAAEPWTPLTCGWAPAILGLTELAGSATLGGSGVREARSWSGEQGSLECELVITEE
jgi:hypothetical protein